LSLFLACLNLIYAQTPATLTVITDSTKDGAACLDGTPPAYYFHKGSGSGANKWFLHHQGGGYCVSLDDCLGRSKTDLGSSKGYGQNTDLGGGYFSTDVNTNPLMYKWNMVLFMYFDGLFYGGNNATISVVNSQNIYFRGFKNLQAYLKDLTTRYNLQSGTDFIVGGCSAGGVATHLQLDSWTDNLPKTSTVRGLPDSGFIINYNTALGNQLAAIMKWAVKQMNFTSDPACVKDHADQCIWPEYAAPYVTTPMFPLQSQFDAWQLQNILGSSDPNTVNQFGQALETRFKSTVLKNPKSGCFLDSCVHHCGSWNSILINNVDSGQALKNWYEGQTGQYFQDRKYPCDPCCNRGLNESIAAL